MCGICGYISKEQAEPAQHEQRLANMLDRLYQRGPDDVGTYHQGPAHIGMRRLAIIDLQGGHQPFLDESGQYSLVYNGELYNYLALKKQMENNAALFRTCSDTEVVLQAFLHFRQDCWQRFNGMFAVALWNAPQQELVLARDRFGQKPLYYIHRPGFFAFASDIRSLLTHPGIDAEINYSLLPDYLQLRHVPGPDTLIKHIRQLPAGHYLTLSNTFELKIQQYWSPQFVPDHRMNLEQFQQEFEGLWPRAIEGHLLSDVTVGGFLSGGVDSSLIALEACRQKPDFKTLSIAFDDPAFDESHWAQEIADYCGAGHSVYNFSGSLSSSVELWNKAYDQPFSDPASFPLLALCQEARKSMTVALSGDGADELFAGYQRYNSLLLSQKIRKLPGFIRSAGRLTLQGLARLMPAASSSRRYLDAISRRLNLIQGDLYKEYIQQFHLFGDSALSSILVHPEISSTVSLNPQHAEILPDLLEYDLTHWLPDQMLVKTDRASMGVSLETRLPFLDNGIVDLALRTPAPLLIHKKILKYGLRSVAARHLPSSVSQRRKHGFAVPVDQWLRQEADWVQDEIRSGLSHAPEAFRPDQVQLLLDQHFSGRANHGEPLLTLLLFFVWKHNLVKNTHQAVQQGAV